MTIYNYKTEGIRHLWIDRYKDRPLCGGDVPLGTPLPWDISIVADYANLLDVTLDNEVCGACAFELAEVTGFGAFYG